jgi:hypothetical protein
MGTVASNARKQNNSMWGLAMSPTQIDGLIKLLLPRVLADPELGDGRTFTPMHLRNLWALSCLQAGECYDERLIEHHVVRHLPPNVLMVREVAYR